MSDSRHLVPPATGHPVWEALSRYTIGPVDAALPFAARLARENGWRPAHAARAIEEYRRFCFLAVTADHPVTPSDAVDQVWHLHLTYSRDYWERFCPDILGRPLHHGPTAGGADEHRRHVEQYARTLRSYERAFGRSAPADLWPSAMRTLIDDARARRVHPRDGLLIPPVALWLLAGIAMAVAAAHFTWW